MSVTAEAEELALSLSEPERAKLAGKLLASLPVDLVDDDDGIDEAVRRSREMDEDSAMSQSHEEFMRSFEEYRR